MFLKNTVDDILAHIEADTEVIVTLDGQWPVEPLPQHPRLNVIYLPESVGQRAATNIACRLSRSKYVMKCDAHCAFDQGFDRKLIEDMQDDWTVVPMMYNLHCFDWVCECGHRRYQGPSDPCEKCGKEMRREIIWKPRISRCSTSMRFDRDLKFQYWGAYKKKQEGELVETMSLLGACWMLTRERYWALDICDENHGGWGQQGTEVACKTWLSGGRLICNKKTWFSHMFRTQGGDFGFPYNLSGKEVAKARKYSKNLWLNGKWDKAKYSLDWLIKKFAPVPDWNEAPAKIKERGEPTKALVYYTHSRCNERILLACRQQITKCMAKYGYPIIAVSQLPIHFGKNIVVDLKPGVLSLFMQVLRGIEETDAKYVFLLEHDLFYHPSHFDFTPPEDGTFYYDRNRWAVCNQTGKAVFYHTNLPSMLCANRELLLKHYRRRVDLTKKNGFRSSLGYSPPRGLPKEERVGGYKTYFAEFPSLDIRHELSWTRKRMDKSQFRSERSCRGWTESTDVPGWGVIGQQFESILMSAFK
jgi:glycosyltransferase involved in cell wall biosynthesis